MQDWEQKYWLADSHTASQGLSWANPGSPQRVKNTSPSTSVPTEHRASDNALAEVSLSRGCVWSSHWLCPLWEAPH